MFRPAYIETFEKGRLRGKVEAAAKLLAGCRLCPRNCGVNRKAGERGACRTGPGPTVSSIGPHFGEEPPLVGRHGSGTIFLTGCNLLCSYCQNYEISHLEQGEEVSAAELAALILSLQNRGCHNINFVSPTHQVPQILAALEIAVPKGLTVPLVYNTGGYDSRETLTLLDGVFDIYLPDFKYWDGETAGKLSPGAGDYPEKSREALKEMHRQVGDLVTDEEGIAERGLLIRHLILPGGLAGTTEVMRFIATEISKESYVNIMDQYHPGGETGDFPPLDRRLTAREYGEAIEAARREGLHRGFPAYGPPHLGPG